MSKRQKRILLALGWYDYRLHRGIEKYAQEQGWHLCPDTTREKVVPWGWEGDGILVDRHGQRAKLIIPELALETSVDVRPDLPLNSTVRLAARSVNLTELDAIFKVST